LYVEHPSIDGCFFCGHFYAILNDKASKVKTELRILFFTLIHVHREGCHTELFYTGQCHPERCHSELVELLSKDCQTLK
jgi:hypothetical protein